MKQQLELAVARVVQDALGVETSVELTRPEEQFGDYATNVALQLAKQLGRPPREIADQLAAQLRDALAAQVGEVSVAGPGFINLRLTDAALTTGIAQHSTDALLRKDLAGRKVLVEYSDPNPFKPLHAGHLYTTLVGDAIARLEDRGGAQVVRLNYGGDVGLHVGKSMWAILRSFDGEHPEKLDLIPENERPQWMGARYVEGNTAYEENESAKAEIIATNKRVYQLHADGDHDSPFAQIYWTCRQWSYDYFAMLYDQLGVHSFDRFIPESEVTPLGVATVQEQLEKGVYERSEGAVVYKADDKNPGQGLHTRVFITSEGLPAYEAKEMGLLLTKWRDYHFDKSIVITASEQDQYMRVVLASASAFEPEAVSRTRHINHGVVKLQGGIKFSSRKGNAITALDVIESARQAGLDSGRAVTEDTILAAIKYAFLRVRIGSDVVYDPNESIALEGNSGPYLQYAHARARSILAKAAVPSEVGAAKPGRSAGVEAGNVGDLEPGERSLVRKLSEYDEAVAKAVTELLPHYICTYLYELAQAFNSFYEHNRVIGNQREQLRLHLVRTYADTLKDGLGLLGIIAPDSM